MTLALKTRNQPVTTAVHAFLAPVQRDPLVPTVFDPSKAATFDLESPPHPWIGIGAVENFQRSAADENAPVQAGTESVVIAQFRKKVEAHVGFDLRRWGKLQMALAGGGTQWNVLEPLPGSSPSAVGGEAVPASPVLPGSTATVIRLEPEVAGTYKPGDLMAVDFDYLQQTGYVGLGFSAAYISPAQPVQSGSDFIRRVTFNLAQVAEINGGEIKLDSALPGGDPPPTSAAQKVIGFVSREGGSFRQEWSALFFEETVSGGRVCYYYPRLQSATPGAERRNPLLGDYQSLLMKVSLIALPGTDPQDGVSALWYRTYVPPASGA